MKSKKVTLRTPYLKLQNTLWESKKIVFQKQREQILLRSKLNHSLKPKDVDKKRDKHSLKQKYSCQFQQLESQLYKLKNQLTQTAKSIEEREYERIKRTVRNKQNQINFFSKKGKKLQKEHQILQKRYNKDGEQSNRQSHIGDQLKEIEKIQTEIEAQIKGKKNTSKQLQGINAQMTNQILHLLSIKNYLRNFPKNTTQSPNPSIKFG